MPKQIITQKRLQELLHYDPETGNFTWKVRKAICVKIDDAAGGLHHSGYIHIVVDGTQHRAHRLAFLYMTGEFPIHQVDHKNHVRNDNRWDNLSDVTHAVNGRNQSMRNTNTSGVIGVSWFKASGKWHAQIWANGKRKHLGFFIDIADAISARKKAEIKYDYHKNHGLARHN